MAARSINGYLCCLRSRRPFIGNKLRKEIEEEILSPEDDENDNNESVGTSDA